MDVGHVLSNFPPIIENVFKYLTKRELDCCAQVCDLWKRVAETEKNRRGDIVLFFRVLPCTHHETVHSNYTEECSLQITGDMESDLKEQLKELKIKPKFCLAFASSFLVNDFGQFFPSFHSPLSSQAKRLKQENLKAVIETSFGQYLPENCPTTFCVAPGIIGSDRDLLPLEIENGYGISSIIIPFVPGLHIYNFPADGKQCDISKLIPDDVDIKCLLVFTTKPASRYSKIIKQCLLKQDSKLALGGALIERSDSGCGSFVAFCGQSVEAASIVINPEFKEAEIEKKLMLFKKTGLLKDRCFAFMFSCVARGHFIYNKYNVESSIFHKLYPEIPLIGIFGNGETGLDYLPNVPCQNSDKLSGTYQNKKSLLHIGKISHSYTTIFVLVSLKL